MHVRTPKHFVLEERLERYADAIELNPPAYAGRWAEACHPITAAGAARYKEVRLDLGCGKGTFLAEAARREPDVLFLGMDSEPLCIAYAAQHVMEAGLKNAVVLPWNGLRAFEVFGPAEVSRIYLNFPTPFPRKRHAAGRLTDASRLMEWRRILAPGGTVRLKTDSQPLYDFSLEQVETAGYQLLWTSLDARADFPDDPTSTYEERLAEKGAHVLALEATPGPEPKDFKPLPPKSLTDYLPRDLTGVDYVPLGMEATVKNMRNYQAKQWAKNGGNK
jgi:tRNA (guanine-N7-)-methyltransferase